MLHCDKSMLQCTDILPHGRLPHDFSEESICFLTRDACASNAQLLCMYVSCHAAKAEHPAPAERRDVVPQGLLDRTAKPGDDNNRLALVCV
jgi:hypothetical protein